MHEVNMSCQIDAQLGAQTDKIKESMTLGLWFVWTIRAECKKKSTNPHKKKQKELCVCSSKCTCNKMVWSVMKSCRMYIVGQALYLEEPYFEKFDHTLNI